jgi:cupin fold WbuC family metalloprotein
MTIAVRKESDEVLYTDEDVVLVNEMDLAELKQLSLLNPRRRIRLCAHRSPSADLHEMFIIHTHETYVRPHRHFGKAESFSIIEGEVDVVLFHDDGRIRQLIQMGSMGSGLPFYYRLSDPIYHTLVIRSRFLVFHEVTSGPFKREQTEYAAWSPADLAVATYQHESTETIAGRMVEGRTTHEH